MFQTSESRASTSHRRHRTRAATIEASGANGGNAAPRVRYRQWCPTEGRVDTGDAPDPDHRHIASERPTLLN